MNRIYEATKYNGARTLVPSTVIDRYVRMARIHYGNGNRALRMTERFLASYMYVNDFKSLVEIKFGVDGSQSRTTVIVKR